MCVLLEIFLKVVENILGAWKITSLFNLFYVKWQCLYIRSLQLCQVYVFNFSFLFYFAFLSFLRIGNEWKRLSNFASYTLSRVCRLHWRLYACQDWNFIRMSIFLNKYQGRQKYWPTLKWEWEPRQRPEMLWPEANTFLKKIDSWGAHRFLMNLS